MNEHKANLDKLRKTGFFATEFIEDYNQIILTLDKKLRNKEFEYGEWLVHDLPPFRFANDVDPWTLCQDVPYDNPRPWDFVEIKVIDLDSEEGKIKWKWGNLKAGTHPDWGKFEYKFRVTKENNKWKISYLEGFEFEESTRQDG
jgi:hypothetical protein